MGAVSRRGFLTGTFRPRAAALTVTGGLVWTRLVEAAEAAGFCLRPPGALDAAAFLATCLKCGQCVEACPFGTLHLASQADDAVGGTPTFTPRQIPCEMCEDVPCAEACPSGALDPEVPIDEARMGLAVLLDRETCLAHLGLRCETCYRACPLIDQAIVIEHRTEGDGAASFIPTVDSDHCTGCGACERACVIEVPAIKVISRELAQGALGEHYRFDSPSLTSPSVGARSPAAVQPPPTWGPRGDVVDAMNDLGGIVE